jgi:aminoglycoside phosphotransferase (APT) family kinase protein
MTSPPTHRDRRGIYYWKCDRPAAFHGTSGEPGAAAIEPRLRAAIQAAFPGRTVALRPAAGQGNHRTFIASLDGEEAFVRVEDGPERDDYLEVESHVLDLVARAGIPAPRVLAVDATRAQVPFAWQVLEKIPHPDLNQLYKRGELRLEDVAEKIGAAVARWQSIAPRGFGPFRTATVRAQAALEGFHARYEDYFLLHLDRHLDFLTSRAFLSPAERAEISHEIESHRSLLGLERACLVHKDLALWNILGTAHEIAAFIDFDDAIGGDPMDDLSLLGCFYEGAVLSRALAGYATIRPLPSDARRRLWLHLLRNMIVKAVIRVGAGYFDRNDGFFLIGAGTSGADLKTFTRARLFAALQGLRRDEEIERL